VAASANYARLIETIEKLRNALLPSPFEPTGAYEQPEIAHLQTVSFRILVHAEMEAYLEEIAQLLFQEAWSAWDQHGTPSKVIIGLLAFSGREHTGPPSSLKLHNALSDVSICLEKAQGVWRHAVKTNHGLKEENLLKLLLPLGISADDLDSMLLTDLTSFGSARGEVAHSSPLKIKQYADPKDEYDKVTRLATDLKKIDSLIMRAIKEVKLLEKALVPTVIVPQAIPNHESAHTVE